ncbi:MAG: hypothetical protein MZV65_31180 [Chromatiales bacterium]|nr:hypothetical protein [Chromatiales bacterium]
MVIFVLGTLAIGFIVPNSEINLTQKNLLVARDDVLPGLRDAVDGFECWRWRCSRA